MAVGQIRLTDGLGQINGAEPLLTESTFRQLLFRFGADSGKRFVVRSLKIRLMRTYERAF